MESEVRTGGCSVVVKFCSLLGLTKPGAVTYLPQGDNCLCLDDHEDIWAFLSS